MRKCQIVLGSQLGDEGKGMMTDYLCRKAIEDPGKDYRTTPIVIRHGGGHNSTHQVNYNGKRHLFSQFGSGSFQNVPTYYSKYCTFYPTAAVREYAALDILGVDPTLYLDALAPVTTHYDLFYNRAVENFRNNKRHGSCGVGFGATVERHETPYKLYARDLWYPSVVRLKLNAIKKYYDEKILWDAEAVKTSFYSNDFKLADDVFLDAVDFMPFAHCVNEEEFFKENKHKFHTVIFEGSQGILLDMDFGFFPHVTRSNTTSKNAMAIINRNGLHEGRTDMPEIFYLTRAYQTRHGEGPMSDKHSHLLNLKTNPHETNVKNDWQGNFRKGLLDIDLLNYAMACDNNFSAGLTKNLVITCMDQIDGKWMALKDGKPIELKDSKELGPHLYIEPYLIKESHSDSPSNLKNTYFLGDKRYM